MGSGSQKSGWQTVEEVEETGTYEPSSPSCSPTDPQYEPEIDATIDATMLPEDAKRFLMDHAEYGYNGYISSKGSERKVVVVGKPYLLLDEPHLLVCRAAGQPFQVCKGQQARKVQFATMYYLRSVEHYQSTWWG